MVEREEATLDRVFHALSDPSRRAMLRRLAGGSLTVSELAEPLPMSLAAASKHIKVLEKSGLLRRDVQWRTHLCTLNAKPLASAQTWLDFYEQFWDERFDALEEMFRRRRKQREKGMSQTPPNSVVVTREFTASAAEVFEVWINPEIMRHWLAPGDNVVLEIEADARIGGALLIRSRSPDGAIHTIRGVYRELDPPRRIAMSWTYSGPFALICAVETLIEIDFEHVGQNRTAMTFTQSQFVSEDVAKAYEGDWPSCFEKLQNMLGLPAQRQH